MRTKYSERVLWSAYNFMVSEQRRFRTDFKDRLKKLPFHVFLDCKLKRHLNTFCISLTNYTYGNKFISVTLSTFCYFFILDKMKNNLQIK